jgi:hypothetical protein
MMKKEEVIHAGSDSLTSWYLASRHREVPCNPLHALENHTQQNEDPLENKFQPPSSSPCLRISLADDVSGIERKWTRKTRR